MKRGLTSLPLCTLPVTVTMPTELLQHGNMLGWSANGSPASGSTQACSAHIRYAEPKPHSFTVAPATYAQCNYCSVTRHTAREHSTEAKVHYPYHPQFGETVIVKRRLVTHDVEMAVILQPDGSLACLPAWMLAESAAQH